MLLLHLKVTVSSIMQLLTTSRPPVAMDGCSNSVLCLSGCRLWPSSQCKRCYQSRCILHWTFVS